MLNFSPLALDRTHLSLRINLKTAARSTGALNWWSNNRDKRGEESENIPFSAFNSCHCLRRSSLSSAR
jgi:hypothetical protein